MKSRALILQNKISEEKRGISLMILAIITVVVIILASTIFVMLSTTNPIAEGKMAKFQYDRDSMQAAFTSTVSKVMAKSKSTIKVQPGQLNDIKSGVENATGEAYYTVNYPQKNKASSGTITFDKGKNEDGSFYTGKQLPIYKDGETTWYVDDDGILTLKVGDEVYGDGKTGDIIKDFTLVGNKNSVDIKITIADDTKVDEYVYYIREPGEKEWNEYRSPEPEIEIDGLKEGTRYEVKVEVIKDGKTEEAGPKEVVTKNPQESDTGKLIMKVNNKNGKNYEEGTWVNDKIYVRVDGSDISYKAEGANVVKDTTGESLLTNEGITTVTVTTKDGDKTVTKEYTVKIDKQPPEGNAEWNVNLKDENKSDITVTLVDVRDNLSGIKEYEYYLNGKKIETTPNKIYTFEDLPDGVYDVKVVIIDNAGNKKEIEKSFVVGVPNANDENRVKVEKTPTTWTNQNVKLKLTYTSEDIYTPQYSDDGNTWIDVTRIYEKEIGENTKVYVRFIYHGDKDIAGKSREIIIDNIDKESPVINSIRSNNTDPTNDNITLVGKAIDTQSGIEEFQFSTESNLTADSSGWKQIINSTSEITETSRISDNGTYYFYVKDAVGNVSKKEIVIDNIDREPPEITSLDTTSKDPTNSGIVITGKAIDRKSGIIAYQFSTSKNLNVNSGGWTTIDTTNEEITENYNITENGTYYFYVKDAAENISRREIVIENIDTIGPSDEPPQVSSNTNSITATIAQTDESGINKDSIKFAIKKSTEDTWGEWISSDGNESYTFTNLEMETSYDIKTMVSDAIGNVTESRVATISTASISKPTISAPNEWTNKDVQVRIAYPEISGTTKQYSIDGENWTSLEYYEMSIRITVSENNTTVYARLIDSDNQTSGNATYKVTCIDKENPVINSLELNSNGAINGNVILTAKAIDTLSGISAYQFSTAGNLLPSSTGWKSVNVTNEEIVQTMEITKNGTYYFYVRDLAGNMYKQSIVVNTIDKDLPIITSLTSSNTEPTNQDISIIGKAIDETTGIVAYQFSTDSNLTSDSDGWTQIPKTNEEIVKTQPISENGTYYFYVKDEAGNIAKKEIVIDNIDKIVPTVNIGTNGGTYKILARSLNVDVSTRLDASDEGGSGIGTLQYQFSTSETIPADDDTNWKNFSNNSTITDLLSGGTYYLYTKVYDNAGNRALTIQKSNPYVIDYQILYDANEGSNAPGEQIKKHGEDITLSSDIPVREGYTFLGWNRDKRADTPEYTAGSVYSANEAPMLYAIWQANTFTATFDANGGVTANPTTLTRKYNERLGTLPTTSRDGYIFNGWYTDPTVGELINSYTLMPSNNVTYYAHWGENPELLIISNPTSVSVIEGNSFEFNVEAIGNGTLIYQWYYNTTGLPEGGVKIDGATSPTYKDTAAKSMDGRYYYCEVSLQLESSTDKKTCVPAQLTVLDANYSITNSGKTTYYTTLAEANVDAVSNGGASNGGTIVTLKNVTDKSVAIIDKTITLNTNGKTITRDSLIGVDNANVSFTVNGGGKIVSSSYVLRNLGSGTLNVQNVTLQTTAEGYTPVVNDSNGNITISGAQISATGASFGVDNSSTGNITMSSGSISSSGGYGVYNESAGIVNIAGGTINAGNAIVNSSSGKINITGGTIASSANAIVNQNAEGTVSIDGASTNINAESGMTISNSGKLLEVKNGTITGKSNIIVNEGTGTVKVSGGTISTTSTTAPAIYNLENGAIQISSGNITSGGAVVYNNTGTLAVTGGTIKGTGANSALHNEAGLVTISNGNISTKTGVGLTNRSSNTNSNISGGTIDGASGNAISNEGIFEIKGGTIKSASLTVNNKGTKTLKITGGTISSTSTANTFAVGNASSGILEISKGTITTTCSGVYNNTGTLTITGGELIGNGTGTVIANQAGKLSFSNGKVTANTGVGLANVSTLTSYISGTASIDAKVGNAIINTGIFEIKNGTITSGNNTVINSGTKALTINGGNISSTGTNCIGVYNSNSGTIDFNAGIITSKGTGAVNSTGTVRVNGSSISGTTGTGLSNESGTANIVTGSVTSVGCGVRTKSGGTTNISGGTISAGNSSLQGNAIINSETGKTIITGGSISTAQGIIMYNDGSGSIKITHPTANINGGGFPVFFNAGSGTVEINSGTYKTSGMHVIENATTGTVKITGGTMYTDGDYSVIHNAKSGTATISGGNFSAQKNIVYNNSGRTTISGGSYSGGERATYVSLTEQKGFALVKNESGILNMTAGTVNAVGFGVYNVASSGNITVTGGSVTSQTSVGMYLRYGTITVGSNSAALSTSNPIITGSQIGVENEEDIVGYSTGTFNFYNGLIRGGEAYEGSINSRRSGATLTSGTSGGYRAAYYR